VVFVVDKAAPGQVLSEYFRFPCQYSFHKLLHTHHHLSSGAGTIGQTVAAVPSGLKSHPTKNINNTKEALGINDSTYGFYLHVRY
jgi:hypothetical protein